MGTIIRGSHLAFGVYSPQRCDKMGDSSISCKRQRIEPYCIIHCTDDNTKLISPNSLDSWKTLQKAAEIRKHEDILSIEVADDQIPNGIFYHRKCRSMFTHKHDLDRIERSQKKRKGGGGGEQLSEETIFKTT